MSMSQHLLHLRSRTIPENLGTVSEGPEETFDHERYQDVEERLTKLLSDYDWSEVSKGAVKDLMRLLVLTGFREFECLTLSRILIKLYWDWEVNMLSVKT